MNQIKTLLDEFGKARYTSRIFAVVYENQSTELAMHFK